MTKRTERTNRRNGIEIESENIGISVDVIRTQLMNSVSHFLFHPYLLHQLLYTYVLSRSLDLLTH